MRSILVLLDPSQVPAESQSLFSIKPTSSATAADTLTSSSSATFAAGSAAGLASALNGITINGAQSQALVVGPYVAVSYVSSVAPDTTGTFSYGGSAIANVIIGEAVENANWTAPVDPKALTLAAFSAGYSARQSGL